MKRTTAAATPTSLDLKTIYRTMLLSRRIDGIMRFEKAKAGFVKRYEHRPSLSRFVGRLRYPVV